MELFTFGIDPVLEYLERQLKGIPIFSLPVQGPMPAPPLSRQPPGRQGRAKVSPSTLPPLEVRYLLVGYCDVLKPVIAQPSGLDEG
jgi:hypothetical protein